MDYKKKYLKYKLKYLTTKKLYAGSGLPPLPPPSAPSSAPPSAPPSAQAAQGPPPAPQVPPPAPQGPAQAIDVFHYLNEEPLYSFLGLPQTPPHDTSNMEENTPKKK